MDDPFSRTLVQLVERSSGLFHFRMWIQPAVATMLGIRAGLKDAKTNEPAYLWAIVFDHSRRGIRLLSGWSDLSRVAALALILDCIYQFVTLRWVYPLEAVIVVVLLAIVPYIAVRGPVARTAKCLNRNASTRPQTVRHKNPGPGCS